MMKAYCFIFVKLWIILLIIKHSQGFISDEDYTLMPPVFHLDDFDTCMLFGDKALYCSIIIQLSPTNPKNSSSVWKIIEEVSKKPKNYRHDRLRYGLCVPYSCPNIRKNLTENDAELNKGISEYYMRKFKNLGLKVRVDYLHCETNKSYYSFDIFHLVVGIFAIFYIIFVIYASIYEGRARYKSKIEYKKIINTPHGRFLSAFSIPNNWYRLTALNKTPQTLELRSIQGLRFYNILCVILVHTCMTAFAGPISNTKYMENLTLKPLNMLLVNGVGAVQTFFIISGVLLSYHFFLIFENQKNVKIKYILMTFVNRYFRLTPVFVFVLAFETTWMVNMSRGPFWDKMVGEEYRFCRKNWWTNLLYINNYYDQKHMCMQHTWYLAAEMQIFLVSLLILTLIKKFQHLAKIIFTVCFIIAISIPGIINYVYDFDIIVRLYPESLYYFLLNVEKWHKIFTPAYMNMGSYILGLAVGYIHYKYRGKKIFRKNVIYVWIWWILAFGLPISISLSASVLYKENYNYSRFGAAVYTSLNGNIFVLGIAIFLFGLMQGEGWFVRYLFEWKPIQVLGRLTYSIYIIHLSMQKMKIGMLRSPMYVSDYLLFLYSSGDAAMSCMIGFILCLIIEMPISALQKHYVPQLKTKDKYSSEDLSAKKIINLNTNRDEECSV